MVAFRLTAQRLTNPSPGNLHSALWGPPGQSLTPEAHQRLPFILFSWHPFSLVAKLLLNYPAGEALANGA